MEVPWLTEMSSLSVLAKRSAVALFPKRPPTCLTIDRTNLVGMTMTDLKTILSLTKYKTYRAHQMYTFLYKERGAKWWRCEALPKDMRLWLDKNYQNVYGSVGEKYESDDGLTRRFLLNSPEGNKVECKGYVFDTFVNLLGVIIDNSDTERTTLCVSSQAGCSLACSFCHTGSQGFKRNLTSAEILAQYMIHPSSKPEHPRPITNVVFMGQGEPLYNWRNVSAAVEVLTDPRAFGLGHSKITISTSGIVPLIPKIATELGVCMAVSLHAPNDQLRSEIMSINKTYPLSALIEACKEFVAKASSATKRITFEYVMLDGVNDSLSCATELAALVTNNFDLHDAHVNLLPFNEWPNAPYKPSSPKTIELFRRVLEEARVSCTVRTPKGRDIMAACGQLAHKHSNSLQ